jgi:hypothetical protein
MPLGFFAPEKTFKPFPNPILNHTNYNHYDIKPYQKQEFPVAAMFVYESGRN